MNSKNNFVEIVNLKEASKFSCIYVVYYDLNLNICYSIMRKQILNIVSVIIIVIISQG